MVSVAAVPLLLLSLLGCGEAPCSEREGLAKDQCLHDELVLLPADQPGAVVAKAGQIQDQMVRNAAVSAWIKDHVNSVPMDKGRELCGLLQGRDQGYCERRLSSPHLKR
jgi:hypothetical protein